MMTLDSVRDSLIGQEDIIIFCLIERAKYPLNSPLYAEFLAGVPDSFVKFIVKETEALHAKVGRYESPEENPFFPENLPPLIVPPHNIPQALSRRIHYGKFVAEAKFMDAPEDYSPAIRAQDRATLMSLLTFENIEEMVKQRVEKKAMVFGQEVSLNDPDDKGKYKVDPSMVSRLYGEWVMPLTKLVQVEYLLRRLN